MSRLFRLFRNKRLFALMIGLIVFVAVMGFSLTKRDKLSWPENFIGDSVTFVQQWFYKPAGYLAGLFEDVRTMKELYRENEQLRMTTAKYARDATAYNFLELEVKRLQEELNFTKQQEKMNDYKFVIAQVVADNQDPYNNVIKINLGSRNGIKPDMAVVTVDGMVGVVSRVFPFYSTVMPITELNTESSGAKPVAATVLGNLDSFGMIDSYDEQTGMLLLSKIAEDDKLKEKDTVITSGLGGVFPRGLVIGTVESRQVGDFGLTHIAEIKPAAKLDRLYEVFVVVPPEMEGLEE
ncbi:rod shape-determining protein MreC [Paenibacillus sambharensis]|uniref:Cell shape-determining protein MreC n=1 Tax=Paenibacillus sambharensis TaxID=1803190 RepID=A0A2W1L2C3_9BACL|nr:rod shape-determining protein MreC [Paenibacillus sambharensis]PZD94118.1 rod shape-determining protein MreC [Paenibacillus sambharensis]